MTRSGSLLPTMRVRIDPGSSTSATGGMKRPRIAFHSCVFTKASRHHFRHRWSVRGLTPTRLRISAALFSVMPCTIAEIRTTTAPRYTRRPKNLSDGGVSRRRQPSRSQQKLSRRQYPSGRPHGPPRGFRGYAARCSRPPHEQLKPRYPSARSRSKSRSARKKLESPSSFCHNCCLLACHTRRQPLCGV